VFAACAPDATPDAITPPDALDALLAWELAALPEASTLPDAAPLFACELDAAPDTRTPPAPLDVFAACVLAALPETLTAPETLDVFAAWVLAALPVTPDADVVYAAASNHACPELASRPVIVIVSVSVCPAEFAE
jgi:hypothetical protein